MTINATLGVKSIKYAVIPATGQTPAVASVGDVYQDTANFVTNDPTVTEHISETSSKKIVMSTKNGHKLTFSIMDPTDTIMKAFLGDDYSGGAKEMKFEVEPEKGKILTIDSASTRAKINTTYSAKGITLLDVEADTTGAIHYADPA